jgi:hypothetical protein
MEEMISEKKLRREGSSSSSNTLACASHSARSRVSASLMLPQPPHPHPHPPASADANRLSLQGWWGEGIRGRTDTPAAHERNASPRRRGAAGQRGGCGATAA